MNPPHWISLVSTSPLPAGAKNGPCIKMPSTNDPRTAAKTMAPRPRLPRRKWPDPGISQAAIITSKGGRRGAAVTSVVAVGAGIPFSLAVAPFGGRGCQKFDHVMLSAFRSGRIDDQKSTDAGWIRSEDGWVLWA